MMACAPLVGVEASLCPMMDGQYSPKSSQLYVTNLFCP
jgi:hypothetical protein